MATPHSNQHPLFATLIRKFGEFLFEMDLSEKFLTAWTSRNALLQKRRASVFGKRPDEVFSLEISRSLRQIVHPVLRENLRMDCEFPIELPAGSRWFHALAYPVGRSTKRPSSVCLMARDITRRKTAEFSFRKREALLRPR